MRLYFIFFYVAYILYMLFSSLIFYSLLYCHCYIGSSLVQLTSFASFLSIQCLYSIFIPILFFYSIYSGIHSIFLYSIYLYFYIHLSSIFYCTLPSLYTSPSSPPHRLNLDSSTTTAHHIHHIPLYSIYLDFLSSSLLFLFLFLFSNMDGVDLTKAVFNKGKQMASVATSAANANGGKKRRKGTDLKPIVTNDPSAPDQPTEYVACFLLSCSVLVLTTTDRMPLPPKAKTKLKPPPRRKTPRTTSKAATTPSLSAKPTTMVATS